MLLGTPRLVDPSVDLWVTEGSRKADAAVSAGLCCIALTGVWNWRGTNDDGGKVALADWESIALNDRRIVLAFDSDSTSKVSVYDALSRLAAFLTSRGADVHFAHLPNDGDNKAGLDDFIAAHGAAALSEQLVIDRTIGERPHTPIDLPTAVDQLNMTDTGNAERLVALHGADIRFVPAWRQWLCWDQTHWRRDLGDVRAMEMGKSVARELWRRIGEMQPGDKARDSNIRWAKQSESATTISNSLRLARGLPGVPIEHDELDAEPWLLNVVNGTIDLRTGELGPHNPEQLHSMIAGTWWDANATAPRWQQFLEAILPDDEVRAYVQRAVGYSITGLTTEQVMFLAIGNGSNGKSTLINAITKVAGDYAGPVAKDLIVTQRNEPHPTSAADLFRLRFAVAVETEATNALAEAKVKGLTGSDLVKARRMGEDFWHFEPTHKLWLAANYLPKITGTDNGIWRRIRVVPFAVEIGDADRDANLPSALAEELPGILRWIVQGCLDWQRYGLATPQQVRDATDAYRAESDWFTQFCDESGWQVGNGLHTTAKELNDSFRGWAQANGEALSRNVLARELDKRGCRQSRNGSARMWINIGKADGWEL